MKYIATMQPHVFIQECVKQMQANLYLRERLGHMYDVQHCDLNPIWFGEPIRRERRYSGGDHYEHVQQDVRFEKDTFMPLVKASMQVQGDVFFMVPPQHLNDQDVAMHTRRMKSRLLRRNSSDMPDCTLPVATRAESFQRLIDAGTYIDSDVYFANVSQNASHHPKLCGVVPTLLQQSNVYMFKTSKTESRLARAVEHLAMQQMPLMLSAGHIHENDFPYQLLLDSGNLTSCDVKC